ncbi:MAG: tetratricopeptide repeat protein [Candidatus Aminicenantes bacterium]|nr:tetratricopeptide repeat protein [Candidatus Aminicenantes bacterium]
MKRKEKEHLKADPFVHFFEQALTFFKNNRRPILAGAGIALLLVIILLAILLYSSLSAAGESKLYASAFAIRNDGSLSIEQKIAKLQELKFKNGISGAGRIFIAALYYEKGDLADAEKTLQQCPDSRIPVINDQKQLLSSRLLAAAGKNREAMDLLKRMVEDKKTALNKEVILLLLAKLQANNRLQQEADSTLKRILNEYPNTASAMQAQNLLNASVVADPLVQ